MGRGEREKGRGERKGGRKRRRKGGDIGWRMDTRRHRQMQ